MILLHLVTGITLVSMLHGISNGTSQVKELNYDIVEEREPPSLIAQLGTDLSLPITTNSQLEFILMDTSDFAKDIFTVEETSGQVWTNRKIDRDVLCPGKVECIVHLKIMVQPEEFFRILKIKLKITDINDCAPAFREPMFLIKIPETAGPGMTFALDSAVDNDSPQHGVKSYYFNSDGSDDVFQLKVKQRSNGKFDLRLKLLKHLDREKTERYQLKVTAEDSSIPAKKGEMFINITVVDINDNPPVFNKSHYEIQIREDWSRNRPILRLKAYDPDIGKNGEIVYSLLKSSPEINQLFRVHGRSGEIYVKTKIEYRPEAYEFRVRATDQGPVQLADIADITVRVEDVNDHAPAIEMTAKGHGPMAKVKENTKPHTDVAFIRVTDADSGTNGEFSCNLDQNIFELRKIEESTYGLRAQKELDREDKAIYNVTVSCFDHGEPRKWSSSVISVLIEDENDNAPQFIGLPYAATLQENNYIDAKVTMVHARDADDGDNGRVEYELADNTDLLTINPSTGQVRAKAVFDFEQRQTLSFVVVAHDRGVPSKSSSAVVKLNIKDANDEPPKFDKTSYRINTPENGAAGDEVGQVSATDGDAPPYNDVVYSIEPSSSPIDTFAIEPSTGKIRTKRSLDREVKESYNLVILATDTGVPPLSSTASVTIYVKDRNDNKPIIDYPNPFNDTVYVSSNIPAGYKITKIFAHDIDDDVNAKLSYYLSPPLEDSFFGVEQWTGLIFLQSALDVTDRQTRFSGNIIVKDSGSPPLTATTTIKIIFDKTIVFKAEGRPLVVTEPSAVLTGPNLWILIAIGSMAGVVIVVLIVVLLCLKKKTPEPLAGYKYWSAMPPVLPRSQPATTDRCPLPERAPAARPSTISSESSSLTRRRDNFGVVLQQSALSSSNESTQANRKVSRN